MLVFSSLPFLLMQTKPW